MKNYKELLVGMALGIIVILGILGIQKFEGKSPDSILPIKLTENDKKNKEVFLEKVAQVFSASQSKYLSDKLSGDVSEKYYDSNDKDLSVSDVYYYIKMDKDGNIVHAIINDNNYKIIAGNDTSTTGIIIGDVDKKYDVSKLDEKSNYQVGDINKNGKLDLEDASLILTTTNISKDIGDLNNDGVVDKDDANVIINMLSKNTLAGDVNKDGKIDSKDSEIVNSYVNNKTTTNNNNNTGNNSSVKLEENQKATADVNKDGKVDYADAEEITKAASKPVTASYVVRHWTQKMPKALDPNEGKKDSEHYTLVDTQKLTATALSKVTPATKSYPGFKSPSKQSVTVLSNGTTVVDYYYTRNKYKFVLYSDRNVSAETTTGMVLGSAFGGKAGKDTYGPTAPNTNQDNLWKVIDTDLYYEEEIHFDLSDSEDNIVWIDNNKVFATSKVYFIRMGNSDVTLTVCNEDIPKKTAKYVVNHYTQKIAEDIKDTNHYTLYKKEEVKAIPNNLVEPKTISDYAFKLTYNVPTTQKVRVNKDGTTVVNYYYTRKKSKLIVKATPSTAITCSTKYDYPNKDGMDGKTIVASSLKSSSTSLVDKINESYYIGQKVSLTVDNGSDKTVWKNSNGTQIKKGKTYEFVMGIDDFTINVTR